MDKVDSYEKLNKPGVWFVKTGQPCTELFKYVYELAVELGLPVVVYSSASKREIQNNVIEMIKKKCVDMASDELERNWLEQEMTEYNSHGFFWYPKDMNDYLPNGSFWSNYVFIDEFKILRFTNDFSNSFLIDNLSELWYDEINDDNLSKLPLIEKEAVEYKKTLVVFIASSSTETPSEFVENHLF